MGSLFGSPPAVAILTPYMGASPWKIICAALVPIALVLSIVRLSAPVQTTYAALSATEEPHWGVELVGPNEELVEDSAVVSGQSVKNPPSFKRAELFTPDPTQTTLEVQVLDARGAPLIGAHVACSPFESEGPKQAQQLVSAHRGSLVLAPRTDQEGRCMLVLPPMDRARVTVISANSGRVLHSKEVLNLRAGSKRQLQLLGHLSPPQPWYVKLGNPPAQEPYRDPWILSFNLETLRDKINVANPQFLSPIDGDVFASILDITAAQVLLIGAHGMAPQAMMMRPGHSLRNHPYQVNLRPGGRLRIQTIPGSELTLRAPLCALGSNVPQIPIEWHWTADQNGWIQADGLPTGVKLDLIWSPVMPDAPEQIELDEHTPIALDLAPLGGSAGLSGVLRDSTGAALAHTSLWLVPATRKGTVHLAPETRPLRRLVSDAKGTFHMEGVPSAAWWICPEPGHGWAATTRWFEVSKDAKEVRLDLQALPARAIAGQVTDEQGAAVAEATLCLTEEGGRVLAQRTSDSNGGFSFEAPTGQKLYIQTQASGSHGSSPLTLCPTSLHPMKLRVRRGAQMHGVLLTPGNELSKGSHQVLLHSPDKAPERLVITGAFFSLDGLAQGRHALAVLDATGRVGTLVMDLGQESAPPVTVRMGQGQTTQVLNPTDAPLDCELTSAGAVWMRATLQPGTSRTVAVPAHSLQLRFGSPKSELPQQLSFPDRVPPRISLKQDH